jgi:site-specific DNA-cytosine methylase
VLLENVPGLLNWHMRDDPPQPPAITHVVSELERLGYRWAHRVIGLTGFGIPQRRRRVFVVASRDGDPRDVLLAPQAVCLGQCLEMHRPPGGDVLRANAGLGTDRGTDSETDGCIDDETHRHSKKKRNNSDAFPERACVECALDAAASPAAARAKADRHSACAHGARECYECFRTPPLVTPTRVVASIDLAEKRHGPMLDELFTLTTANGRRMCLVERDASSGAGRRGMLHVEDAERLMGLPAGWTEPVYPLNTPGKPRRTMDYKYAELVARNGRAAAESAAANSADPPGSRDVSDPPDDDRATTARTEENARRAFAQRANEFSAATYKRFEKLGLAVAVPQARWLGERLMRPYDLKFARAGDGIKFARAVPGGPNAAVGGVVDRRDRRVQRAAPSGFDPLASEPDGEFEAPSGGVDEDARIEIDDEGGGGDIDEDAVATKTARSSGSRSVLDDARLEAAAAASGWPDAAYNVHPSSGWRARFALPECGDAPVIRGFVPLGEFLVKKPGEWPEAPLEQARGYVKRLRLAHVHVEPFVARALGEKQTAAEKKTAGKRKRGPGEEGDGEETREETAPPDVAAEGGVSGDDGVPAGRVVWAPWLLGRGPPARRARVFWPALALHAHDDRDQIPPDAFDALAKVQPVPSRGEGAAAADDASIGPSVSDTHVLVVYFGDKTYEWRESDALLDFLEHKDELAEQPLLRTRARFLRGVALANEWHAEQRRLGVTPAIRRASEARARAEERLRRAVGAAGGDGSGAGALPPASCGVCRVCACNKQAETAVPFSARHLSRACATATAASARRLLDRTARRQSAQHPNALCPQIGAIVEARRGHVGACLTLLRERAVGRRVRVHWPDEADRGPFAGTVAGFDAEFLTHAVAYDDGDVEPACRLWKETVHLGVPEDAQAEAERAQRREQGVSSGARGGVGEGTRDARAKGRAARAAARARNAEREPARAPGPRGPGRPPASGRGRGGRGGGGGGGRGQKEACVVG